MTGAPLRVLQVSNFMPPHPGGIETLVELLVNGLLESGVEARWVASAEPAAPGIDGNRTRLPAWNPFEARIHVPMPLWGPAALATVAEAVRRADVVHVHECVNLSTWSAVALARRARRPVVLTQHVGYVPYGPVLDRVERLAYHGAGRAILERVDARVVVSPHVADWFRSIGVRAPFSWIPNARDERRFRLADAQERRDARSRFGVSPAETVVLFAARFVPKKGVDVVAEVWPRIAARRPDWRLVVAGEGPLESELRRLPGVVFLGQQPQAAMPELFAAADVFWLPSHGEGFPLTVQEAMLCGLPVVVSRDPSYLANLAGIEGAWLVEADGIAGALDAARSVDRAAVAEGARGRWSRRVMVDRYLDLYRQVRGSAGA